MNKTEKYRQAIQKFDEANSKDPNQEDVNGETYPAELLYAERMTQWLDNLDPKASEVLRLAARCQHIERWVIPREEYPMNRQGYIKWRNELKKYHAQRAEEILGDVGYDTDTIDRVKKLVQKKGLKTDPEVQMLEDVICLVFLEYYFEDFSRKHEDDKLKDILKKTLRKMSPEGRKIAMKLKFPDRLEKLVEAAIN
jgi:hypothetical protein